MRLVTHLIIGTFENMREKLHLTVYSLKFISLRNEESQCVKTAADV